LYLARGLLKNFSHPRWRSEPFPMVRPAFCMSFGQG
jgi:hypothetical protein